MRLSMTKTKNSRVGVIVRQDLTGLGVQTRGIARLLDASKIIVIDFGSINGNEQHPETLDGLTKNRQIIKGFVKPEDIDSILKGIDVLITCEIDYSPGYALIARAKELGIKTVVVVNYEFCDWLQNPLLPMPNIIANHSEWNNEKLEKLFGDVPILKSPVDMAAYTPIYRQNRSKLDKPRFLHIAGRKTYEDRNGTQDLLAAIKLIPKDIDFELVIKTQTTEVECDDPRVRIDREEPADERELYRWYDAMILPRRYAGASLPMNEALASGLPVIMTDIDPNNKILPHFWLVPAEKRTEFMARTMIDVYSADHTALAARISQFAVLDDLSRIFHKDKARGIAVEQYSYEVIKHNWDLLFEKLGV